MATYKLVDSEKLEADLTTVADAIRAKTGGEEPLSFPEGMAGEVDAVFEAGKKSEWDAFWDLYQNDGNVTDYSYLFSGSGWTEKNFKPKYNIVPVRMENTFRYTRYLDIDLAQHLEDLGIVLDTKNCTVFSNAFAYSKLKRVGVLDTRSANYASEMFGSADNLEIIDKLIIRNEGNQTFVNAFRNCKKLRSITIDGVFGANIDFKESIELTQKSIISIINALSSTTSNLTVTLSATAVNTAFETSAGAADGSVSEEWTTLIATKSNWTISLV